MLILEAIGPRGEELALAAADARGYPVGWDSRVQLGDDRRRRTSTTRSCEAVIFEELDARDPEWRSHLQPVE